MHDDPAWVAAHVRRLTAHHEAARARPWSVDDAPPAFVDGQLGAIVGLEVLISRIQAKAKLSQNRSPEDVAGVVAGLEDAGRPGHGAGRVQSPVTGPWFAGVTRGATTCDRSTSQGERVIRWVGNIEETTLSNETFRTAVHTGDHLQLTVMCLKPGEEIGREAHPDLDQFIRVEQGQARVELGATEDAVDESHDVADDWAVIILAGTWHNVVNTGSSDLKLYSIYTPPEHPAGTVHRTKAQADAAEEQHHSS